MKSKYNSLGEWRKNDIRGYEAAIRNGIIDEICEMFGWKRKISNKKNSEAEILVKLGLDINEYLEYKINTGNNGGKT